MQLIRGIEQLRSVHKPSVVSIGNYDGVHLGHQHVISTLLRHSKRLQAPSTVVTFEPLAKEFFRPHSVMRLTGVDERAELLFALGVDRVLCIDFTAEFAAYAPVDFVESVLIKGLGTQYLCVGDDFRFGKDRAGDFDLLKKIGTERGFEVRAHETFTLEGARVSSGRVRGALQDGNFKLAAQLLGRSFTISGTVSHGQQLGRTLNFPTANIVLPDSVLPVNGVYAVSVTLSSGANVQHVQHVQGVANVGTRPTVGGNENRLEVHLFDFDRDIYAEPIRVTFCHKIRDEQKFVSVNELKAQIKRDVVVAKGYLSDF